jgi:hypothetical protein
VRGGQRTLLRVLERGVEVVDNLGEALGRVLGALLVENVNLDSPLLHREAFHLSRLVAI